MIKGDCVEELANSGKKDMDDISQELIVWSSKSCVCVISVGTTVHRFVKSTPTAHDFQLYCEQHHGTTS